MEEFSTAPIPGSTRAEDERRPPAHEARHHQENRPPVQSLELETNQEDDEPANTEPKHHLDISV
jgi:hypothetical protein